MGKYHRHSNFARNAAAFGVTIAGAIAPVIPTTNANPLNGIQGVSNDFDTPQVVGLQDVVGKFNDVIGQVTSGSVTNVAAPSTSSTIVSAACSKTGSPHVWGATGLNPFDCSGPAPWAYQQVGKSIPHTSQAQVSQGTLVFGPAPDDIIPFYSGVTYVDIFSGNGNAAHAPQSGGVVKEVPADHMLVHNFVHF